MFISSVKSIFSNKREVVFITILLAVSIPLRFINLGYSDYIGDEHKSFIEPSDDQSLSEFFLTRRKGPMQFLFSEIPHAFTGDFRNELAERLPYSVISVLCVLLFYALVTKLTKSKEIGFVSSLLFSLNGLMIGFGRIAQYQNLNLLFSFASLYFYADLQDKKEGLMKSTLVGTLMFCLSFLSHWDAIFILPLVFVFFVQFFLNKEHSPQFKLKLVVVNFALGCLILLPFLIPFIRMQHETPANLQYLRRRLDFGYFNSVRYKFLIDLYNPFLTYWFLFLTILLSFIWFRISSNFFFWFFVTYGVFELFVRKPGTHIYNFLIPAFILAGIAVVNLIKISPKIVRSILYGVVSLVMVFFFYQSHVIFVDHTVEYPWENEVLFTFACPQMEDRLRRFTRCGEFVKDNFETKDYSIEDKLPLFGFPLYRHWNEINTIVQADMQKYGGGYGFMTNEEKTISQWYMEPRYSTEGGFYAIGVKRPLSFREDWQFAHVGRKNLVDELYNGERLVVKIWRIDPVNE